MKREKGLLSKLSYWQSFRFIFTLLSLYLMNDAFSRWDGFSHYATFFEFLPSVSLAFILWSIIAVFITISSWIILRIIVWFFIKIDSKIKIEHLFILTGFFVVFGTLVWKGKKIIWPDVQTTIQMKLIVLVCVVLVTVFFTIITRNKAEQWINVIQDRITPLVWIFSIFFFFSVPLVIYHAWFKDDVKAVSKKKKEEYVFDGNRPNIILVTFDALAAREMSLYGYHKETTPFINNWAKQATVFAKAKAASNFTASTTASIMTGKRVWTHQTYHIEGSSPIKSDVESLPSLLKDNGYFNIALVVNPFASVKVLGIDRGFDTAPPASEFGAPASLFGWKFGFVDVMLYRAFGEKIRLHNWILKNDFIFSKLLNLISRNISRTTVPPEKAFNRLIEIVDDNVPEPFFAWVHVFPPHDPYLPPEPFWGSFHTSQDLRTYKMQEKLIEYSYKYLFQYKPIPENIKPAVNRMREYYDEFVMYIDRQFGDFIEELDRRNLQNTVIILSADHGESFEHGYFTHGGPFLYEQATHIPLIIKEPGQLQGQTVDALVEQIDIPATILDLARIPVPAWMEGRSLTPFIRGETLPNRPAFSMNYEENRSRGHQIERGSIAVWDGDYKLIHYLDRDESLLFNIERDPDERVNLVDREPLISKHLLRLIKGNLEEINNKIIYEK
jgi:arylsulfatase A-like enzyme